MLDMAPGNRSPDEAQRRAERLAGPHGYAAAEYARQEQADGQAWARVEAVGRSVALVCGTAVVLGLLIAHLLGVL